MSRDATASLLAFDINRVEKVEVTTPDGTTTLARKEGRWVAVDMWDYPADFEKVADELRRLAALERGQIIRGGETMLEECGLGDGATRVAFFGPGGGELGNLTLGRTRQSPGDGAFGGAPGGTYVRAGDGPVLLVEEQFGALPRNARGWVDADLLRIPPSEVAELTVASGEAETYRVLKQGADGYNMDGLGPDEEIDKGKADQLAGSMRYLTFTEVADPARTEEELGFNQAATLRLKTTEDLVYTVTLGAAPDENTRFARLNVAYEAPEPPQPPPAIEGEATEGDEPEGEVADPYQQQKDEYDARVERLSRQADEENRRFAGWTYVLQKYNSDNMLLPRGELVKKVTPEEPPTGSDAPQDPDSPAEPAADTPGNS